MNSNIENKKVWFVTGASKGLGLALAKKLLAEGYRVAATSRNAEALIKAVGEKSNDFLPLEMDLLNGESVSDAIQKRLTFRRNHVVVNNAVTAARNFGRMSDRESGRISMSMF